MGKPYVLGVDDEPMNLMILEDMLDEDYEVGLVASGQACLDAVKKKKPDLILLDVHMSHMDGFEVCRTLKKGLRTKDIPVVFLTAKAEKEAEEKGLSVGGAAYVTKPFTYQDLLDAVSNNLSV